MKNAIIIAGALLAAGCSSADEANRTLQGAGYTSVQTTGYRFFGCDKADEFHTGFIATGQNGKRVSGTVCSGLFKGATIRMD